MESGHLRCAFEGNPQPIYFGWNLALMTILLSTCTICCLPQFRGIRGARIPSPHATYRILTQRERQRGHGTVFKVAECVSRVPGTSLDYFFEGSLRCELQGHWELPQPMHHPWSHCRFISLGVNLQEEEEEAATSGWNPTGIHLRCDTYTETERARHHFQGCYLSWDSRMFSMKFGYLNLLFLWRKLAMWDAAAAAACLTLYLRLSVLKGSPQPMHHPWPLCSCPLKADVNIYKVLLCLSAWGIRAVWFRKVDGMLLTGNWPTLRYLHTKTEGAWHHYQGCYLSWDLQNGFHGIRAPKSASEVTDLFVWIISSTGCQCCSKHVQKSLTQLHGILPEIHLPCCSYTERQERAWRHSQGCYLKLRFAKWVSWNPEAPQSASLKEACRVTSPSPLSLKFLHWQDCPNLCILHGHFAGKSSFPNEEDEEEEEDGGGVERATFLTWRCKCSATAFAEGTPLAMR